MMLLVASMGSMIGLYPCFVVLTHTFLSYLSHSGQRNSLMLMPDITATLTPTIMSDSSRDQAIIRALSAHNIDTAIQIISAISSPAPSDIKPISTGVRLMLDHLYIIDATDLQMPTVRAKMDAALRLADLAIAAAPDLPDGWCAKALALNWEYQGQDALSLILSVRTRWPLDPTAILVQAEIETDLHAYSSANRLLDQAIPLIDTTSPVNKALLARAYYIRGNLDQNLGHSEQAIADYRAAWDISRTPYNPADPWMVVPPGYILYQLGPIYLFKNQISVAQQFYNEALTIDKQDPFLYYLLGRADRFSGHIKEAIAEFQQCLVMDHQQWRCARNLGQIAFLVADWHSVIQFIQPIVDDNSQISDDYYYLAMAYAKLNECSVVAPIIQNGETLLLHATGHPAWKQSDFDKLAAMCQISLRSQTTRTNR